MGGSPLVQSRLGGGRARVSPKPHAQEEPMSAPEIILRLTPPPWLNNIFVNVLGRGRVPSKRYKSWQRTAGWELQTQRQGCIGGPWEVAIALPENLTGDCDNYVKPLLDLLVKHAVVDDDRHCR